MIKREEIVIEMPLKIDAVTVVTVSEVTGRYQFGKHSFNVFCHKRPLAVAVTSASHGIRAFSISGEEMPIDELLRKFPDTRPLIEQTEKKEGNQQ